MTTVHEHVPHDFAVLLDHECEGMTDLQKVQARHIAMLSLRFARVQYEQVGLALKNSEPDLIGRKTVRK